MGDDQREQNQAAAAPQEQQRVSAYAGAASPGFPGSGGGYPHFTGPVAPPATGPAWPFERPAPPAPRRAKGVVAAAIIAGIVGGGLGFGGAYALLGAGGAAIPQLTSQAPSGGTASLVPGSVGAAAAKVTPSTVDIQVRMAQGAAEGSGVILTADGNVLTNNHVVAGATGPIVVTLADGTEHQATVVGTSPSYDLAVIKLQGVSGLTPATLGQSAALQIGQPVVAIGSPQGLTGTVTTGIVSAFNRTVTTEGENGSPPIVYNGLQTDTAINPGNSGGPLVNLDGQVIGINSAIAGNDTTGLGFAIPVDQARRIAQEIMTTGTATKPVLGVSGNTANAGGSGARIATVVPGSPAATAGLAAGDVVTKVGDSRVEDFSDLVARIGAGAPGDTVRLTVMSGTTQKTVDVTLGSQPDRAATTANDTGTGGPFEGTPGRGPFGGN